MMIMPYITSFAAEAKRSLMEKCAPKKYKEFREEALQSEESELFKELYDLVGEGNFEYITALGESFDTAYEVSNVISRAASSGVPLTVSAMDALKVATEYDEETISKAIDIKTLIEFLKGKGITPETAKTVGVISNHLYDEKTGLLRDTKEVATQLKVPEIDVAMIASMMNEFKVVHGGTAKPFTIQQEAADPKITQPHQAKQQKQPSNKKQQAKHQQPQQEQQVIVS